MYVPTNFCTEMIKKEFFFEKCKDYISTYQKLLSGAQIGNSVRFTEPANKQYLEAC